MKISDGIKEVEKSAKPVVSILVTLAIGLLIVGVISGVAIGGTITLPAAVVTYFNGTWLTSVVSVFTTTTGVLVTVISLLVIGVLIVLFGMGKSGKSGKSM